MLGCSIEEILREYGAGISMVHFARKPFHDGFSVWPYPHHVVKDEQITGTQISHQFLVV
jgi:hypothetical protein